MKRWAKGHNVRFWKDGLLTELQAQMSRGCIFLLFWHHNYQVTLNLSYWPLQTLMPQTTDDIKCHWYLCKLESPYKTVDHKKSISKLPQQVPVLKYWILVWTDFTVRLSMQVCLSCQPKKCLLNLLWGWVAIPLPQTYRQRHLKCACLYWR